MRPIGDLAYTICIWAELGIGASVFVLLFFITAPYGRHYRKGWGFTVTERFAWMFMESPSFLMIPFFFILCKGYTSIVLIVFVLLWELHYFQRTIIYPLLFPKSRKIFPLAVAFMALFFNLMNGYIQSYCLFVKAPHYPVTWFLDVRFIAGAALFIAGYGINLDSDKILREIGLKSNGSYAIPFGGMYRFISSPNYFGEIIEWIGWALFTWSLPGLVFALFTLANLFPRAIAHHRWYRNNFPDYPKERKAIIPFIL